MPHDTKFTRAMAHLARTAALPLALAACTFGDPTPTPEATLMAAPWTSVPVTAEPTVDPAAAATATNAAEVPAGPATATMDVVAFATQLSATIAALASPAPTEPPRVAVNTAVPIAGCAVPNVPPIVRVMLAPDAPDIVKAWWSAESLAPRTFDGEVVTSDEGGTSMRFRSTHDGAAFEITILSSVPVPLSPGRQVRVSWDDQRSRELSVHGGTGYGLFISDDDGLVALVVALGFTLATNGQLLAGERGGVTIQQLRSPCAVGQSSGCGYTEHAAPVAFARGATTLTLGPGENGVLTSPDGGPAYGVRLETSHVLLSEDTRACSDRTPWVLSYSVVRQ